MMEPMDIKRKLRELKRLESRLQPGGKKPVFIWDSFFDLHETSAGKARYSLARLTAMNHEEFKKVIDEYLEFVCRELFRQNDPSADTHYDTDALIRLGLPFDADEQTVKKKFRELAMLYHPDTGGDAGKFIELMETYRKLTR